ncbi:phage tail protein [Porphyrobacter sp. YT40]|nr:phage tail protein [Porphyrobacter sp. YT40]
MVPNPATRIPAGARLISDERFEHLMAAQAAGLQIIMSGGKPMAVNRQPDAEERRAARRRRRDQLLAASDWTQLPDSPLDLGQQALWRGYRQLLRDLDMDGDSWPSAPGETA